MGWGYWDNYFSCKSRGVLSSLPWSFGPKGVREMKAGNLTTRIPRSSRYVTFLPFSRFFSGEFRYQFYTQDPEDPGMPGICGSLWGLL